MKQLLLASSMPDCLDLIKLDAIERCGVPHELAQHACEATARALEGESSAPRYERRARAYFWAVIRRSLTRTHTAPEVRARFMLSTVASDMRSAGRSPAAVWDEMVRGWADKVPIHVLEEYRERLCA